MKPSVFRRRHVKQSEFESFGAATPTQSDSGIFHALEAIFFLDLLSRDLENVVVIQLPFFDCNIFQ